MTPFEIKRNKVIKVRAENDLMFFARYLFMSSHGRKFKQYEHLQKIVDVLHKVAKGEIKRLIINIPPRYGKTELAVKLFISWGLALNPQSKFLHLSYSDDLALDNSSAAKEYVQSEAFQNIWNIELKGDSKSKKKWYTKQGGGLYATSSGGAVTGFGAGNPEQIEENETIEEFVEYLSDYSGFNGAIILDDPLKPEDSKSDLKRNSINDRYNNTIRSRTNDRNTPIIVIMQRLHENDLTGFLMNNGSGEDWTILKLSAIQEDDTALCPDKHNIDELRILEQAAPYMFAGQMQQNPAPLEGGKIKKEWFEIVSKNEFPQNAKIDIWIDGAYTKKTTNDPTGIDLFCFYKNVLYWLFSFDKHLEMPELLEYIKTIPDNFNINSSSRVYIEPKASGKSLKQLLTKYTNLNAIEIKSKLVNEGKIAGVDATSPAMEAGKIKMIAGNWNEHVLNQLAVFPNGTHDEHVDNLYYAIDKYLGVKSIWSYT